MFDIFRNVNSIYELGAEQINYGEVVCWWWWKKVISKNEILYFMVFTLSRTLTY